MTLTLPWPPSVNHYWRHNRGVTHISTEGRKYRQAVHGAVLVSSDRTRLDGRLSVAMVAYPPDKRRRDLDNMLKAVLDSLEHAGVYQDDSQIDRLSILRGDVSRNAGYLSIAIVEIEAVRREAL